ncbi:pyruvate formate-lyase activating enzyme [Bifidobacterium ramosum]|uniref:AmmeMemoRadiSam system radical SAM enzyme n=1 Tax=Bifidobacterium ramosum TaxID=1798158 RepID=A0A6L4X2A7_9BIFI|nr:AmmeMemoRadiSam system radical SAM enzyme [Bifidobacterium ramosum]KAB8289020.1 pyruvate formate-lyase activating enzyme [Bifidobacterium ramosum]NEG70734.1 AmmeMemoRadiSam system radical SAM enzyme [Bifidobacterium ramosum]
MMNTNGPTSTTVTKSGITESAAAARTADRDPAIGRWQHRLSDGRAQCDLCPRHCTLRDGQRGFCFVRSNHHGMIMLDAYGLSSGFAMDPVEKKPLNHFHPGSAVLSFGTAGCNSACRYCQNWSISASRQWSTLAVEASPERIAAVAAEYGARSVAFTYNDPIIFAEYAIDTAQACHARGIEAIAVTAGYMESAPRTDFYRVMDAANIDLKGFTEDFYRTVTGTHLHDVLDTIAYVCNETDTWVELTTLLIPGYNDDDAQLHAECAWIREHCGRDVPLHFSAFHPDYRMRDVPPTPLATLVHAREIAMEEGLRFVYTGNVIDREGGTTYCLDCGAALVVRDRYEIDGYRLTPDGRCPDCGCVIPGRWDADGAGDFGCRRWRVAMRA